MDYRKIEDLLKKYWDTETSVEEEQQLRSYFNNKNNEIPDHLKEFAPLFRYFEREKAVKTDQSLDKNFSSKLDDYTTYKINNSRRFSQNFLKIAAAVIFVILMSIGIQQIVTDDTPDKSQVVSTYEDPEKAFEETKKALLLVSAKLNEGTAHAIDGLATINKVNRQVKNIN